jgi:hypothetical protein
MNSKTALLSAVLSALALIASGASASTSTETSLSATVPSASSAVEQLARGGRRNDDPVGGEDAGCDDHGTDLCAYKLSKHGADDAVGDDNGVDFIIGKHGADDAVGDDNGVDFILAKHGADDLVDGEDDHGVDFILG